MKLNPSIQYEAIKDNFETAGANIFLIGSSCLKWFSSKQGKATEFLPGPQ